MPGWLKTWLVIAAIAGGVMLLWVGFMVVVAVLAIALIPYWLWTLVGRPRGRPGPVTIEGAAQRVEEPALVAPLTDEEKARLGATRVWIVEYRDEFSHDESPSAYERYAYHVAVCFSAADAEAEASRRGERFKPGWAGFDVYGPVSQLAEFRDDGHPGNILREVLARLASGSREPIPMRV